MSLNSNFLITVWISLIVAISLIIFIILVIPPTIIFEIGLLLLIGYVINVITALFLMKIDRKAGHESSRQIFRKNYKKGVLIGALAILILLVI